MREGHHTISLGVLYMKSSDKVPQGQLSNCMNRIIIILIQKDEVNIHPQCVKAVTDLLFSPSVRHIFTNTVKPAGRQLRNYEENSEHLIMNMLQTSPDIWHITRRDHVWRAAVSTVTSYCYSKEHEQVGGFRALSPSYDAKFLVVA